MPNWSYNHTIFVGPKTALDDIARTITPEREFDFNQILPTPPVLETFSAPAKVVSDDEFASKYNLAQAPTTIEALCEFAEAQNSPYGLNEVPATVHRTIVETYGSDDWYTWRVNNWGTKWTGDNAEAQRFSDNLLIVTHNTAWSPPSALFMHLRNTYDTLHIINGVDVEGFSDGIEASDGTLTAFLTYFTSTSSVDIEPYDFSHLPNFATASDEAKQGVDLWYNEQCEINTANIDTLIEHGYLVGEEGEIMRITDL